MRLRLRLILAAVLTLHLGFAPAGMSLTAPDSVSQATLVQTHAGMTHCHDQASQAPAPHSKHHSGCCDAGNCYCAAACALPTVVAAFAVRADGSTPSFELRTTLATVRSPELRPPIF